MTVQMTFTDEFGWIVDAILAERQRQDDKWGDQGGHTVAMWSAILGEEFGEVCEAVLKAGPYATARESGTSDESMSESAEQRWLHVRDELVQVAAVAVAWLEHMTEMRYSAYGGQT